METVTNKQGVYSMDSIRALKIHKPLPRGFKGEVYPCNEIVINPFTSVEIFCDAHTAAVYKELFRNKYILDNLRSDEDQNEYLYWAEAICIMRAWLYKYTSSEQYKDLLKYF